MSETFSSHAEMRIALLRRAIAGQPESPDLLFKLADALADYGDYDEYARVFQRGYLLRPSYLPKLGNVSPDARFREAAKLRDKAQALVDRGVVYSPVVAAVAISNAILGNKAAVARLLDYDRFFRCIPSVAPKEFASSDFYSTLAAEIATNLNFYDEPPNRSIRKAWRHDGFMKSELPASRALATEIRRRVDNYIAALPPDMDHPFIASRPSDYVIKGWGVVSRGAGHHLAHIHCEAWMSGVYYVVRPDISRVPGTDCGWLRVGPPERFAVSPADGWQERVVEPEPGNLVLIPGYFFHSTRPTGVEQERICIAFDIVPMDLASAGSDSSEY